MRLLHTADWQIGMKAAHLGVAAWRAREARLDAAREIPRLAAEHRVDLIVVAGDTFEHNGVDRRAVREVAEMLQRAPCPVYVLPGNHDPLETGSVWEQPVWSESGNVEVLRVPEPVDAGAAILYPCPLTERWSNNDPTAWIPSALGADLAADRIHIGVAHGSIAGVPNAERGHPVAAAHSLDYLALGHWHSTAIYGRTAYSGTPEPSRFGERESGNVLLVDIERGAEPMFQTIRTGKLVWIAIDGSLREAVRELESIADPASTLIDCRVNGFLAAGDQSMLERLERLLAGPFVHARLDRSALLPAPDDDQWVAQLPPGYLREAAARLRGHGDETAAGALLELYGLLPR
ncbi:MAG: metallophosphoesterase [Bryobacteraceae bacterium]